jgi:hypothetical protein
MERPAFFVGRALAFTGKLTWMERRDEKQESERPDSERMRKLQ